MVVSAYVFETRGGALLGQVQPLTCSWGVGSNDADTVDATFDLNSIEEASRDWRNLGTPWKHSVAVDIGGGRLVGGPIMPHDFGDDNAQLKITARGIRVALARRSALPLAALTTPLVLQSGPDAGKPDPSLDTAISGFDLGTIGKKLTQQAMLWPGWTDIPIVFHADRPGSHERLYPAIDRKKVDDALAELSGVEGGPDIRFQLQWDGPDRFRWVYESGTEEQPRLQGASVFTWEIGRSSGLTVRTNPTRMGSLAWSEGGRSSDSTLLAMMYDPHLVDQGLPLLELESGASSNTATVETLNAWNVETLRTARKPWEFWSFKVPADEPPYPSEYNTGDVVEILVLEHMPVAGGYIPAGSYRRRIVGLSGDEQGAWVQITCGEVYDA